MAAGSIPGWLKEQHEIARAQEEMRRDEALAGALIEARALNYWHEVLNGLQFVANHSPIGLRVIFSHSDYPISPSEDHCRISVTSASISPRMSHADLWYSCTGRVIRCFKSLTGSESVYQFCVVNSQIHVMSVDRCEALTAEEFVRLIVEPMNEYALSMQPKRGF